MSAYMVPHHHIEYLIDMMLEVQQRRDPFRYWFDGQWHEYTHGDRSRATELGQLLWDANLKSIHARYPDSEFDIKNTPAMHEDIDRGEFVYVHKPTAKVRSGYDPLGGAVQLYRSCKCYEYQSCEDTGWTESEAFAVIRQLKDDATDAMIRHVQCGARSTMGEAQWGAPERPADGPVSLMAK